MNRWELAALVLALAMLPCLAVCVRAGAAHALAAVEVASTLTTSLLTLLSEEFHRQPFIDLAIVFSVLGALAFARLMERDL